MRSIPSPSTWSKQHWKIRSPRPLVDSFDLRKVHPKKEWWRERRIAPPTLLGFPDPFHPSTIGLHNFAEQMDVANLVLTLKHAAARQSDCNLRYNEFLPFWSARLSQISSKLNGVEIASVLNSLAELGYTDDHLSITLRSRLAACLPFMRAGDLAEAFKAVVREGKDPVLAQNIAAKIVANLESRDDHDVDELLSVTEACHVSRCAVLQNFILSSHDLSLHIEEILGRLFRVDVTTASLVRLANMCCSLAQDLGPDSTTVKGLCELIALDPRLVGLGGNLLVPLRKLFSVSHINTNSIDKALVSQIAQVDGPTAAALLQTPLPSNAQKVHLAHSALLALPSLPFSAKVNLLVYLTNEGDSRGSQVADLVAKEIVDRPRSLLSLRELFYVTQVVETQASYWTSLLELCSLTMKSVLKSASATQLIEAVKIGGHPLMCRSKTQISNVASRRLGELDLGTLANLLEFSQTRDLEHKIADKLSKTEQMCFPVFVSLAERAQSHFLRAALLDRLRRSCRDWPEEHVQAVSLKLALRGEVTQ